MSEFASLPRPYRDKVLYGTTCDAGFAEFPERFENYQKAQKSKRCELVDFLPLHLDIENVSRCNYRCSMCQVSRWPGSRRGADMSLEDFKALLDSQIGLLEVKIQGMGEPFLGKSFFEMIRYARKRHLWVRSTTNASLLHLNDNYRKVLDADICELQVSIDGASADSYEKIRRGGRFERVRDNCIMLNRYGDQRHRKRTRMWSVMQRDNFHELDAFPRLAADWGFDRLTLCFDLNDWGQDYWKEENARRDISAQLRIDDAHRLIEEGRNLGVELTFWFTAHKYDCADPKTLCPMTFDRLFISSDLRMVPCAGYGDPNLYDLGDARCFKSDWNGEKIIAFRKAHLHGRLPKFCQSCYKQ